MFKHTGIFSKTHLIIIILCVYSLCIHSNVVTAARQNSTSTTYANGMFSSHCKIPILADSLTANAVIDDLIRQFQGDPERLFDWALKGTGQQNDGSDKDAVILVFNSTTFNPQTGISVLNVDAIVPGFTTFRNIDIESLVTDEQLTNGQRRIRVEIFYSGSLLKKAYGIFYVKPVSSTETHLSIQINIKFGWFFNMFITQKRYKALAEFRIEKFMQNLKEESEKRYQEN